MFAGFPEEGASNDSVMVENGGIGYTVGQFNNVIEIHPDRYLLPWLTKILKFAHKVSYCTASMTENFNILNPTGDIQERQIYL